MTQFRGSLRFVQLPAVVQLLSELASTGRLYVSYAEWSGEVIVREGQIVDARLGDEGGRAALEAIVVALPDGEFCFVDDPVAETAEALVSADERPAYLDRLYAEHEQLGELVASLQLVPRLVETPSVESAPSQVTMPASALQLIPALVKGHTLEQVGKAHGLARTLRDVAILMQGGVVELAPGASAAPARASSLAAAPDSSLPPAPEPAAQKPAPARVMPFSARPGARRFWPRQHTQPPVVATPVAVASAAHGRSETTPESALPRPINGAPRPISTGPRPGAGPAAVAERLAVFRPMSELAEASAEVKPPMHQDSHIAPVRAPGTSKHLANLRKAVVDFFVYQDVSPPS